MMTGLLFALLQTTAVAPTPAPTPTPIARPRMICRSMGVQTGSLLPGPRQCHTAEQWHQIEHDQRADADNLRDQMRRDAPAR